MEPKTASPYAALVNEIAAEEYGERDEPFSLKVSPVGQRVLASTPEDQARFAVAAAEWLTEYLISPKPAFRPKPGYTSPRDIVRESMLTLLRRRLPLTPNDVDVLLNWCLREQFTWAAAHMTKVIEDFLIKNEMTFSIQEKIERLILLVKRYEPDPQLRKYRLRLQELSDTKSFRPPFVKGGAWSDTALADLEALEAEDKSHWLKLLNACTKRAVQRQQVNG